MFALVQHIGFLVIKSVNLNSNLAFIFTTLYVQTDINI